MSVRFSSINNSCVMASIDGTTVGYVDGKRDGKALPLNHKFSELSFRPLFSGSLEMGNQIIVEYERQFPILNRGQK